MPQATTTLGGRYELGPELGRGGMAHVHRGRDLQLDREVAVKVLAPPFDRDRAFVARLRREAQAAARLNHPNIVAVYDSGSDGDRHFIVTELVEGETLAELLSRFGRLPVGRAVEIAIGVCRALAAAHAAGVVHRDVKPGNVMLAADGAVKVVDFGIARAAGATSITRSGAVLGSAPYLSPEQARGEPGDERSDLYAVGCVLYEMLTGRAPFVAESAVAALYMHVNERPRPPSSLAPVPAPLEAIAMRCLAKEPRRRFASAAELEAALARVGGDTAVLPAHRSRGVRWWPVAAAAAAALGLVGLGVAALLDDPSRVATDGRERRTTAATSPPASATSPPASPTESPAAAVESSPTVGQAYGALIDTITVELAGGGITDDAAHKLGDLAQKAFEHWEEGKAQDIPKDAEEFLRELAKLGEEGHVSFEPAHEIAAAFDELVLAIEDDLPLEEGPGPPPHAPANGRGGDDDDDDGDDD